MELLKFTNRALQCRRLALAVKKKIAPSAQDKYRPPVWI